MFELLKSKLFGLPSSSMYPSKEARDSRARTEGDQWRDQRRWPEAAAAYVRHLGLHPEDFAIWVQLGHARKESGNLDSAEEAYRRALLIDPNDADLQLNFGHLLQMKGNMTGALQAYRKSHALDGNPIAAQEIDRHHGRLSLN